MPLLLTGSTSLLAAVTREPTDQRVAHTCLEQRAGSQHLHTIMPSAACTHPFITPFLAPCRALP